MFDTTSVTLSFDQEYATLYHNLEWTKVVEQNHHWIRGKWKLVNIPDLWL